MERITITDRDDVKAFIEAQDEARQQACAGFITSRAALRASTYALNFLEFSDLSIENDWTSHLGWRCLLASSVACNIKTKTIKQVADYATMGLAETTPYLNSIQSTVAITVAADLSSLHRNRDVCSLASEVVFASYLATSVVSWFEVSQDINTWVAKSDEIDGTLSINAVPLWTDKNPLEQEWKDVREKLLAADTPDPRGADWSFWVKWYDDILAGNPQNWDMLYEIATTDAIDWDASARQVNDRINQIVERYRLRDEVGALRREVEEARAALANRTQRSHNMPPELVDDTPKIEERLAVVLAAAQEAETELEKQKPNPAILSKVGQTILDFGIWFAKYCGKKVDLGIDTLIKWGAPAAGAIYLSDPQKITELGIAIRTFAGL